MDILKIGVLGIVGVLLAIPLKEQKAEYSLFVSMAVCICIFVYIISKIEILCQYAKSLEAKLPVDGTYLALILKMVGITYVSEFSVHLCKDAGYGAVAAQIEMFAKLSILVISMPVLMSFLDVIGEFL